MEILNNGQVNLNNLYVGIKSTKMFFVEFGDSDIIDEYGLFEKEDYSFGIEGKKKFDVYVDLCDGNKILINDEKALVPSGKDIDIKVYGLTKFMDLLKIHHKEIRKTRRFKPLLELIKYIEKCNEEGVEPIIDIQDESNLFKAIAMCDQLYYLSFGYPIEAIAFFEEIKKENSINFEFKDNRVVTRTRSRKKDEN